MEFKEEQIEKLVNFLSGALASGTSVSLLYPLENIKTVLQLPLVKKI